MSEDAGIEPGAVATLELAVRLSNHSVRLHSSFSTFSAKFPILLALKQTSIEFVFAASPLSSVILRRESARQSLSDDNKKLFFVPFFLMSKGKRIIATMFPRKRDQAQEKSTSISSTSYFRSESKECSRWGHLRHNLT